MSRGAHDLQPVVASVASIFGPFASELSLELLSRSDHEPA